MDITRASEALNPGSNPGGRNLKKNLKLVRELKERIIILIYIKKWIHSKI